MRILGNPKTTLRIATDVIAKAITSVPHTCCFRFSPGYPLPTRHARSPLAVLFCSALALRRGSGHALGGSFARFCVSENVRVPLRYSGQPLRRKIIASRSPNTPWFCLSNWFFANFNQAIDCKSIYADSWDTKINASNRNGHIRITDAPLFVLLFFGTPGTALKCGKRRLVTTDFLPLLLGIFVRLFRHLAVFVQNRS